MAGITHLVEHLVMRAVGRREHPCNAMVDATECIFFADGEPEEVFEFSRASSRLRSATSTSAGSSAERRILDVEADRRSAGVAGRMLGLRYGAAGHGIEAHAEIGLRWVGEPEVRAWCAEHFTRGNAGIWMTAEPPADFALALPDGRRRPVPEPVTRLPGLPGFIDDGIGDVALAGVAPRSHGLRLATCVAEERLLKRLREEHGLSYAPYCDYRAVGAASAHVVLGTDGRDEESTRLLAELWRCASELAEHGATEEELDRERRSSRATGATRRHSRRPLLHRHVRARRAPVPVRRGTGRRARRGRRRRGRGGDGRGARAGAAARDGRLAAAGGHRAADRPASRRSGRR